MYQASADRYLNMSYARCGRSGLKLPKISLGLWQNFGHEASQETAREVLLKSFDAGITHFDLANNYGPPPGSAEENFGRILAADLRSHRDEMIISTKAGYCMWPGPYGEWPEADGNRLCRCLLFPSLRSGHATRGNDDGA
jgi:L-glyceraldehyde 3-phosphate reductase